MSYRIKKTTSKIKRLGITEINYNLQKMGPRTATGSRTWYTIETNLPESRRDIAAAVAWHKNTTARRIANVGRPAMRLAALERAMAAAADGDKILLAELLEQNRKWLKK